MMERAGPERQRQRSESDSDILALLVCTNLLFLAQFQYMRTFK
jgi:hypothetical protein